MKKLIVLSLMVASLLCGCKTSPRRAAFNTLASVGYTTSAAFNVYVDLVIAGKISKETLPTVGGAYTQFQSVFNAALAAVQYATNSVAPISVVEASSGVIRSISEAKGAL